MRKDNLNTFSLQLFETITNRYYWRMMIAGRLVLDSTFRFIAQLLYQFSILSYRIWELPFFAALLPLLRFFTNGCYAAVLLKRALTDEELSRWDLVFNIVSALIFLALGVSYLLCSWAMQPVTVFMLILITNLWDGVLEVKTYIQRNIQMTDLRKQLTGLTLTDDEKAAIKAKLQHLKALEAIQGVYVINLVLTLAAVGVTLFALFAPTSFIAVNIMLFSTPLFFLTGLVCFVHGIRQDENERQWLLYKETLMQTENQHESMEALMVKPASENNLESFDASAPSYTKPQPADMKPSSPRMFTKRPQEHDAFNDPDVDPYKLPSHSITVY